jgi:hypothetical protein
VRQPHSSCPCHSLGQKWEPSQGEPAPTLVPAMKK